MPAWRATVHSADPAVRDALAARARELGVLGWVRLDGDHIAIHAEGDDLDAFLQDVDEKTKAKVEGHEQFGIRGVPAGEFTVFANDGGFALALEVDGAPRIWAVPKGPSMDPSDKRFALPAESAEGDVWDHGPYEQGGRVPWPEAIDRGHAVFVLHGARLQGGFALQRTGRGWLLVKRRE